ncbi:MAG: DEAD/DEAH box helicase [Caldisericota bacterium]|nr:DEAD/DEAH box helicase [Caldisericota bacterium]
MTFDDFHLEPRVAAGVHACGYTIPTPVQVQAIPPALQGLDVMGLAQTGTGKTAAYALPILQRLLAGPKGVLRALVLAPTRELTEQIRACFRELGSGTRLSTMTIYGGVGMGLQVDTLRRGVDIAVACPGRLLDHIGQRTIDLSHIEVLVLDEADMMLDMGFLPDVRRILTYLPARRQNLMYSATMPDPIRALSAAILHEPVTVQIGHAAPVETVSHALFPVPQHLKTTLLLELLLKTDTESVLIFTRTKHRAKKLGDQLMKQGYHAASLQGNLSQNARQAALAGFREGRYSILVATDIAARGIDVSQISHVINYDIPDTTDAYTHRIGRTGRALRSGDAFTLVTSDDGPLVRDIERVLGSSIERRTLDGFDYTKPAPRRDTEFAWDPRPQSRRTPSSADVTPSVGQRTGDQRRSQPVHHRENSVNGRNRPAARPVRTVSGKSAGS